MKIYVTGDTHQENNSEKLSEENFVEQKELTKDDFVIIAGDFGYYWNEKSKKEIASREKLAEKPFTILYIEGNHDNYDLIENLPESEWNGGRVHIDERYGFIHLMRGQVYNINGNKIFTFGGAYSIDKKFRKQGISHWDRELPSEEEYEEGRKNLERVNYEVDYVLTHTCPLSIFHLIPKMSMGYTFEPNYEIETYLEEIYHKLKFKKWFFGHYHIDKRIDEKFYALFESIEEII